MIGHCDIRDRRAFRSAITQPTAAAGTAINAGSSPYAIATPTKAASSRPTRNSTRPTNFARRRPSPCSRESKRASKRVVWFGMAMSKDQVERRGVAPTLIEDALSQSLTPSLAQQRRDRASCSNRLSDRHSTALSHGQASRTHRFRSTVVFKLAESALECHRSRCQRDCVRAPNILPLNRVWRNEGTA
jgi:hypothetical protein